VLVFLAKSVTHVAGQLCYQGRRTVPIHDQ
jgi:hypothetical protein